MCRYTAESSPPPESCNFLSPLVSLTMLLRVATISSLQRPLSLPTTLASFFVRHPELLSGYLLSFFVYLYMRVRMLHELENALPACRCTRLSVVHFLSLPMPINESRPSSPDCPYGDRSTWCKDNIKMPGDCNLKRDLCCGTCSAFANITTTTEMTTAGSFTTLPPQPITSAAPQPPTLPEPPIITLPETPGRVQTQSHTLFRDVSSDLTDTSTWSTILSTDIEIHFT